MPFDVNPLAFSSRWDFVAHAIATTETESLALWTLHADSWLGKIGTPQETLSLFQAGAGHFMRAVAAADVEGGENARKELAAVVAGLGDRGRWEAMRNTGVGPLPLWSVLPDRLQIVTKWGGGAYDPLFITFHDFDSAFRNIVAEKAGRLGRLLFQRAKKERYDFPFALRFCVESGSPLEAADAIEERVRYYDNPPFEIKSFQQMTIPDKIALFVSFRKKFFANRKKMKGEEKIFHSFPSFADFLKYFEMILCYNQRNLLEGFRNPEFPFMWMATLNYRRVLAKYPVDFRVHRIENLPLNLHPYDILYELYRIQREQGVVSNSFELAHRKLGGEKRLDNILAYYRNLREYCVTCEQAEAATFLLLQDIADPVIAEAILSGESPLDNLLNFRRLLKQYGENPVFPMEAKVLDIIRVAALYHLFLNQRKRFYEKFRNRPSFFRFRLLLKMEVHAARLSGETPRLEALAENVAELAENLAHVPEDDLEVFGEFVEVLINYHDRQPANGSLFLNLRQALKTGNEAPIRSFFANFILYLPQDIFSRINELFFRGYSLSGQRLAEFLQSSQGPARFAAIEKRARDLALGAPPGSTEDVPEWMAILKLLSDLPVSPHFIEFILENASLAETDKGTEFFPFEFEAALESLAVHEEIDKAWIRKQVQKILDAADADQWTKKLLQEYESRLPRAVHPELLGFFGAKNREGVMEKAATLDRQAPAFAGARSKSPEFAEYNKTALDFMDTMVRAMAEKGKWDKKTLETMLIALAWHRQPVVKRPIRRYSKQRPANEIVETLQALCEFYTDHFPKTVEHYFGDWGPEAKFIRRSREILEGLLQRLERRALGKTHVRLLPSRSKLDAFFAYVAQDCLATEEYALHALSDPGFVPYRILIDETWQGSVMTFTRHVNGKKVLVITGINPRLDVTLNPADLVEGVVRGFTDIFRRGNYDLLLLPAHPGTQSSRRAFICPEIRARFKTRYSVPEGLNFPKKGKGEGPGDYYGNHKDFLLIASRP